MQLEAFGNEANSVRYCMFCKLYRKRRWTNTPCARPHVNSNHHHCVIRARGFRTFKHIVMKLCPIRKEVGGMHRINFLHTHRDTYPCEKNFPKCFWTPVVGARMISWLYAVKIWHNESGRARAKQMKYDVTDDLCVTLHLIIFVQIPFGFRCSPKLMQYIIDDVLMSNWWFKSWWNL